jgi:Ca-activated chloride channel family protein
MNTSWRTIRSLSRLIVAMIFLECFLEMPSSISKGAEQQPEQSPFSIKVNVDLVILNVTVVDETGKVVTSLGKDDFIIYEDDVKQDIADFLPVEIPFKLVLVIDTSISTRSSIRLIKKAAIHFTEQLRPSDRIAVIEISSSVRLVQDFTSDRRRLQRSIDDISTSSTGGSKIYDGLAQAIGSLRQGEVGRHAVILLSDGMENSSRIGFLELRRLLAQSDVVFYPVTIMNRQNERDMLEDFIKNADRMKPDEVSNVENAKFSLSFLEEVYQVQTERLQALTEESGGKRFLVSDLEDLADEYAKVAQELRSTMSLAYYSKNQTADDNIRRIRVEVRKPGYHVRYRTSYSVHKDSGN